MPELHEMMADAQQWRNLCASQRLPRTTHWTRIEQHFEYYEVFMAYLRLKNGATEGCLVG